MELSKVQGMANLPYKLEYWAKLKNKETCAKPF